MNRMVSISILLAGLGMLFYGILLPGKHEVKKQFETIEKMQQKEADDADSRITGVTKTDNIEKEAIVKSDDLRIKVKFAKVQREVSRYRAEEIEKARKEYLEERHKWIKALHDAFNQAKKDGDYSKYYMLKDMEPDKKLFFP